jgi:uncharacterized membrane protein YvbJ
MKFCSKCGKEILDEAVVCPGCGCAVAPVPSANLATANSVEADEVSIGLCVLAAFIPLFGIIYWPLKHKETPKKAKACGITALISWGVSFVIGMLSSVLFTGIMSEIFYNLY